MFNAQNLEGTTADVVTVLFFFNFVQAVKNTFAAAKSQTSSYQIGDTV